MPKTTFTPRGLACLCLMFGAACSSTMEPMPTPPGAQLNVFPAYAPEYPYPYVFVDRYDTTGAKPSPLMPYGPQASAADPYVRMQGGTIFYATLPAGDHRLMFADSAKTVRADSTLTLGTDSYTTVYLADSLFRPSIVTVTENELALPDGPTTVRFINLSPDSKIDPGIVAADGTTKPANLPQGLTYKTVTPYLPLDSTLALSGKFFLRLYHAGTQVGSAALPAGRGHAYIVLTYGYHAQMTIATPPGGTRSIGFQQSFQTLVRVSH